MMTACLTAPARGNVRMYVDFLVQFVVDRNRFQILGFEDRMASQATDVIDAVAPI